MYLPGRGADPDLLLGAEVLRVQMGASLGDVALHKECADFFGQVAQIGLNVRGERFPYAGGRRDMPRLGRL